MTSKWRNVVGRCWRRKLYVAKMEEMRERAARQAAKAEKRRAKIAAQSNAQAAEMDQVAVPQEGMGEESTPLTLVLHNAEGS